MENFPPYLILKTKHRKMKTTLHIRSNIIHGAKYRGSQKTYCGRWLTSEYEYCECEEIVTCSHCKKEFNARKQEWKVKITKNLRQLQSC